MARIRDGRSIEDYEYPDARRVNIPTAEYQPAMTADEQEPVSVRYPRNTDLDPQLMWRGKDEQDWSDLVVPAPPLSIQELVHPKALLDDLLREGRKVPKEDDQLNIWADFNGIPEGADRTEFYQHDQNWTNRMILGDSLQVMASLAEREGLRGQAQCIYIDPPYGIKFNSNFQWSTTSRDVRDGNPGHITREPEQVKAFRDTWRDGLHSYLTFLRDRLTVARDLLSDTGSVFVQIGDENAHRVRAVMDEVFGGDNVCAVVPFVKTGVQAGDLLPQNVDYILWYAKDFAKVKFRRLYYEKSAGGSGAGQYTYFDAPDGSRRRLSKDEMATAVTDGTRLLRPSPLISEGRTEVGAYQFEFHGSRFDPGSRNHWKTSATGLDRLVKADRIMTLGRMPYYVRYLDDFAAYPIGNVWSDTASSGFAEARTYVVQTSVKVIERCILLATDPGDLVVDPTCGSGTTAYAAEQWGRRWITIDTSRVALALARSRVMGARYPFYVLADSPAGQAKEAEVTHSAPSTRATLGDIRHGFVYDRVPRVTLKAIANNAEVDEVWDRWQAALDSVRGRLNAALSKRWEEWEVPREPNVGWTDEARRLHGEWLEIRTRRQREMDASIAAKADFEYLYDKPYEDPTIVRVAGPFTVESMSPHRMLGVDADGELIDGAKESSPEYGARQSFSETILETLRVSGVQQAHKEDRIAFTSLVPWPGEMVAGEGRYQEGSIGRRAAILIGPEFGTVQRSDLVAAAREAKDGGFDVLIACAFNFEAHATEFTKYGDLPVLKARMNADLHMAEDLKNTGKGNLFVVFGEPDITLLDEPDGRLRVRVNGVDVFKPSTGEVVSSDTDEIACWFIDTDYDEESFRVRHAYFLGANDPYSALKTTLKAEIDREAWESLHSDTSRPFERPAGGRIAVKVINHLGDEVLKVFRV